jgi:hypothetical protein
MSLLDEMRLPYILQARKHSLEDWRGQTPKEYANARINELSNVELIGEIEDAQQRRKEKKNRRDEAAHDAAMEEVYGPHGQG